MMKPAVILLALIAYVGAYQVCNKPVDIVLAVEDSAFLPDPSSAGNLQNFLSNIVNYFRIGPDQGQVAYVQYSQARENDVFFLNSYAETNDAKSAILRTPFRRQGDTPSIAVALNHTWDTLLTVTNGERSCYPSVVILVSYSSYADPDGFGAKIDQEPQDLNAARRLKNSDALIITVGIGPKRNPSLLIELATDPSYYVDLPDFDAATLSEAVSDNIAALACNYPPNGVFYPCEMETVSADFTFVVDRANGFDATTTGEWILTFIQNYLAPYKWGPYQWGVDNIEAGVQASFVTYTKTADIAINFGEARSLSDFITKARTALSNGCQGACTATCVHDALDKVQHHVLDSSNSRYRPTCALHYVFIFTSGCFNCPEDPIPYANAIRASGNGYTEIFVVPLQPSPTFGFWKEPLEIADDASHLYEAQANPQSILTQYLHTQAWRHVCVNRGHAFCSRRPPPATATFLQLTTTMTQPQP